MLSLSKIQSNRSVSVAAGGLIVAFMAVTAFASQSMVQDRRVSLAEAQEMAVQAKGESGFPIVVNDLVVKELNRYVGTPEGRAHMRKSLSRMENYRARGSENAGVPGAHGIDGDSNHRIRLRELGAEQASGLGGRALDVHQVHRKYLGRPIFQSGFIGNR